MKVSLIITTYNSPEALGKVLESVLTQIRKPDEVIVADDGSGEETGEIVRCFSENAPFPVLHVWQEDKGFRAAKIRNEAIKRSSGDYVVLLDGDCVVNRYFVSDHMKLAEKGFFVQGKRVHVRKGAVERFTHEQTGSVLALIRMALTREVENVHHLFRLPILPPVKNKKLKGIKSCNMSFFMEDILAVNGFNEDFVGWGNEDSELALRFFKYGLVKKVHQFMAICFHLWHPTNKTVSNGNQRLVAEAVASDEYFCRNGIHKKD